MVARLFQPVAEIIALNLPWRGIDTKNVDYIDSYSIRPPSKQLRRVFK